MTLTETSGRAVSGEGAARPGPIVLNQLRGQFRVRSTQPVTWDLLLNAACALYWVNRPHLGEFCGTTRGYRRHHQLGQQPCGACLKAYSRWRGAVRELKRRGVWRPARRDVQPCGTRAAAERHRSWGEKPCEICQPAEREWWRLHKQQRRTA